jgi:hypothetical protein
MVLAAALISLAVLGPADGRHSAPAEAQSAVPQSPPPQSTAPDAPSKPYTAEGVRRAIGAKTEPGVDTTAVERDPRGYRMAVATSAATSSPCGFVPNSCGSPWAAPAYPTWHDQMLAMAGPDIEALPSSQMTNAQLLQATASSIGFGLAIQAIVSAIHDQVVKSSYDRKQKKVNRIRDEIHGELDELERVNAAARGSAPVR